MNRVHFSSNTDEWETPKELFDDLDSEFGFSLDVCATRENAKCKSFFTRKDNGLERTWNGTCWMNPPYGKQIGEWVTKAYYSALAGCTVVCLLPARTDNYWFPICQQGEIRFIRGRLKFSNSQHSAPFPSMVVIFRP